MVVDEVCQRVRDFFEAYESTSFDRDELIVRAEDEINHVYYLREGYVRLYAMSEDGRELTLNIFKPGSYFPMTWAIGELINNYYYEAMTDAKVIMAPKDEVVKFIKGDEDVLYELTSRIVRGLGGLAERMEGLFFGNSNSQVASSLMMAAKRFGEKDEKQAMVIGLSLSHQDIASLAGLTRETTSIVMKKFQRAGLISYKRRYVVILDMVGLEKVAGER